MVSRGRVGTGLGMGDVVGRLGVVKVCVVWASVLFWAKVENVEESDRLE